MWCNSTVITRSRLATDSLQVALCSAASPTYFSPGHLFHLGVLDSRQLQLLVAIALWDVEFSSKRLLKCSSLLFRWSNNFPPQSAVALQGASGSFITQFFGTSIHVNHLLSSGHTALSSVSTDSMFSLLPIYYHGMDEKKPIPKSKTQFCSWFLVTLLTFILRKLPTCQLFSKHLVW